MPMSTDQKKIRYSNNIMSNRNELIRRLLTGLTDDKLRNLVRVREELRPIPVLRTINKDNIILPPLEFRDKPIFNQ